MKKNINFLVICLVLLSISFVAAETLNIFKGRVTGNVIADNTVKADSVSCTDSDGGVTATVAGIVNSWITSKDACAGKSKTYLMSDGTKIVGYSQLKEFYCDDEKKYQLMNSSDLGEGYCIKETVIISGKEFKSAKWVSLASTCVPLTNEKGVKDQNNKQYKNKCDGNIYTSYSCNESGVKENVENCSLLSYGKCTANGCSSKDCSDSDSSNDKNTPGVVTVNGTDYLDSCNPQKTGVKEYKCNSNGKVTSGSEGDGFIPCGTNRECITDTATGAGYCRNKYVGVETIETLTAKITALESTIASLTQRIEALENPTVVAA